MKRGIWIGKILVMILVGAGIVVGFGLGTMYLWNWLVPALFAGPVISFWQAIGLLALSKLLFWGLGFGRAGGWGHRHGYWRHHWREKWNAMSPEDRERLKQRMKDKWCRWEQDTSSTKSGVAND
jgi:hypothetical protein